MTFFFSRDRRPLYPCLSWIDGDEFATTVCATLLLHSCYVCLTILKNVKLTLFFQEIRDIIWLFWIGGLSLDQDYRCYRYLYTIIVLHMNHMSVWLSVMWPMYDLFWSIERKLRHSGDFVSFIMKVCNGTLFIYIIERFILRGHQFLSLDWHACYFDSYLIYLQVSKVSGVLVCDHTALESLKSSEVNNACCRDFVPLLLWLFFNFNEWEMARFVCYAI